jgi:DNA-binding transcriptional ArsR family regulator
MDAFAALADPVRHQIVTLLAARDMAAGEIAACFTISRPAVSRHLSVLLRANLVDVREQAQRRVYRLNPAGLDAVDAWVVTCRTTWNARLDARHIDVVARKKPKKSRRR